MFRLNELEGYDGMITRLLKDELEELVMRSVHMSIEIIQERFTHFNIIFAVCKHSVARERVRLKLKLAKELHYFLYLKSEILPSLTAICKCFCQIPKVFSTQ
jgi:hypothetical protein